MFLLTEYLIGLYLEKSESFLNNLRDWIYITAEFSLISVTEPI